MSAHTPGEWFSYELTGPGSIVPVPVAFINGPTIVYRDKSQGFKPEDARLMAASPDLLAALKAMLPEANTEDSHCRPSFETCERARAAIAKAEGA